MEVITRLSRVGYDFAIGYLDGGYDAWSAAGKECDTIESVSVDELVARQTANPLNILDVRKKSEYDSEHVAGAINAPLDYINESMLKVDKQKTSYIHCACRTDIPEGLKKEMKKRNIPIPLSLT